LLSDAEAGVVEVDEKWSTAATKVAIAVMNAVIAPSILTVVEQPLFEV